jgi:cell shape-determining protein MreC
MLEMSKKGDVPITVFVIMVLALFIFALLAFSFSAVNFVKKISEGVNNVAEYNSNAANQEFLGKGGDCFSPIEKKAREYSGLGKEYLEYRVVDMRCAP